VREEAVPCHWVAVDWGRYELDTWVSNGARTSEETKTLEEAFRDLAEKWRIETQFLSSISKAVMHPAYQRIIGMGRPAIPLLLHELQEKPHHWFWALRSITGSDPVRPEYAGDLEGMTQAWLQWGKEHNYI
jgi:hypothetical protein